MARRQVIVQLDDELVAALDEEAARQGTSRSDLIRRAATGLLAAYRVRRQERETVDAYRRVPQDPVLTETFGRIAAETAIAYETR